MKKRPLIIDFSGKAGVGKTYVKDKLIQYLSYEYKCIDFSNYILSIKDFTGFVISMPLNFCFSILFVFLFIPKGYRWISTSLRWWIKIQIMIMKGRTLNSDFVFIDEGLFRRVSLIRIHSFRKISFENIPVLFRQSFLYPDITVFVSADYDLCEKRRLIRDKEKERLKISVPKKKGMMVVEYLKKDIEFAEEIGLVNVIYYNNEGEFETSLIDKIIKLVEKGESDASFQSH